MNSKFVARAVFAGLCGLSLAVAAPARAQTTSGSVHGHVVDEAGKPVPDADISYDCAGDMKLHFSGKTDAKGEYNRGGLQLGNCIWTINVTKGPLTGTSGRLDVPGGNALQVRDITLRAAATAAAAAPGVSAAETNKVFADAKALEAQNNFDGAIAALQGTTTKDPKCAQCFVRLGDAFFQKSGVTTADADKQAALDNAEKAYQAAIAVNEKSKDAGQAYSGLVSVYNSEKRFDDAGKANDKATEIMAAASAPAGPGAPGGGGGGNDATSSYNAGVILFNQSKIPEAEAKFAEAVKLNPNMADAHYQLGMCYVNENKMKEAKGEMQQYIKLAPNGANADTAKAILALP